MKKIDKALVKALIINRKKSANKGDFGHVLVLAGSRGMAGAARLVAAGALRGGAGLVTVGLAKGLYPAIGECLRPEAMVLLLPENKAGGISHSAFAKIASFVKKRGISCIVAGLGMGNTSDSASLVKKIIASFDIPVVLDADALNSLTGNLKVFQKACAKIIVTPHPGEMARRARAMTRMKSSRESTDHFDGRKDQTGLPVRRLRRFSRNRAVHTLTTSVSSSVPASPLISASANSNPSVAR